MVVFEKRIPMETIHIRLKVNKESTSLRLSKVWTFVLLLDFIFQVHHSHTNTLLVDATNEEVVMKDKKCAERMCNG